MGIVDTAAHCEGCRVRDEIIYSLRAEVEALVTQRDAAWDAAIDAALSAVVRLPVTGRNTAHDANHAAWAAIRALRGEGEK